MGLGGGGARGGGGGGIDIRVQNLPFWDRSLLFFTSRFGEAERLYRECVREGSQEHVTIVELQLQGGRITPQEGACETTTVTGGSDDVTGGLEVNLEMDKLMNGQLGVMLGGWVNRWGLGQWFKVVCVYMYECGGGGRCN